MLKLEKISKNYESFKLENIDLLINKSEILSLVGPSGAGKSTVVKIIAGIIKPDSGDIFFNGTKITEFSPEKRNFGYIPQNSGLFPHKNVQENILYPLKIRRIERKKRKKLMGELVTLFRLNKLLKRKPKNLSGGEKQKVALVRSLVFNPSIILMDEPMTSIDFQQRDFFLEEIKKVRKNFEIPIIYISHNFEEAITIADKISVIKDGVIIRKGTPEQIIKQPDNLWIASFVKEKNIFPGYFKGENFFIKDSSLSIKTGIQKTEKSYISIRADEIIVSKKPLESSALNCFKGKIKEVINLSHNIQLNIKVKEIFFKVIVTEKSRSRMNMQKNKDVYISFKANSVKELSID